MALANDLKLEGNTLFRDGLHEEALSKYELALQAVKDAPSSSEIQAICHANRAACFSKLVCSFNHFSGHSILNYFIMELEGHSYRHFVS